MTPSTPLAPRRTDKRCVFKMGYHLVLGFSLKYSRDVHFCHGVSVRVRWRLISSLCCLNDQAKVPLNEYEFPEKKISNVQAQLERLIEKNYYLNKSAKEAYRSYLQAYASHQMKEIFNVHGLDLIGTAKSFCFTTPPKVNVNLMGGGKGERVKRRGGGGGIGEG